MDHDQGPTGSGWLAALESSGLGETLRQSVWLYPLVEIAHILGFALLVGAILAFDLRLLGVRSARLPAEALSRLLLPVAVTGFARMASLRTTAAGRSWRIISTKRIRRAR